MSDQDRPVLAVMAVLAAVIIVYAAVLLVRVVAARG